MNRQAMTGAGAILAAAVGAMFLAGPALAQASGSAAPAQVKCMAGNSCKGQSACKSFDHSCKGQNSCKGNGFVMTPTAKACTDAGGHPAN